MGISKWRRLDFGRCARSRVPARLAEPINWLIAVVSDLHRKLRVPSSSE